jgi:hypothetical protein
MRTIGPFDPTAGRRGDVEYGQERGDTAPGGVSPRGKGIAMAHVLQSQGAPTAARVVGVVRQAGRFGLHLLEMCMVMCIGIAVLDVPFLALARAVGYSNPITDLPELATLVVAFNMSLPMALWMRVRRHDRTCIRDVCGAMFVEAVVLIAIAAVGAFPRESLVAWQHSLMIPAMVVAMLLHLEMYTRPVRHVAAA